MNTTGTGARIALKNVLFLTDFSEPSQAALPFALAIGREFGATIHALHVLTPAPLVCAAPETAAVAVEAQEEFAEAEMQRVETQLAGVPHDSTLVRGFGIWPAIEQAITEVRADLLVIGTHGRTGAQKLLLGSVAEEIFRRSPIPVLTIGPWARKEVHNGAHFHRVLYATDFTAESLAAAPYAISLAQENEARLILLNVVHERDQEAESRRTVTSVANLMYELHELVPKDAELWCRPEGVVEYGEPAARILEAAKQRNADLIVLGVRDHGGRLGAATHLERAVAHKVVAHAKCPVLTVRG
jgi:nucleotide-binding universal stress UspA family protein